LLSQHFGVVWWRNPKTSVAKIIVHPIHQRAVEAMGINPNHPLILWIDLQQPSGPDLLDSYSTNRSPAQGADSFPDVDVDVDRLLARQTRANAHLKALEARMAALEADINLHGIP
jgi:hypothetical protein